MICLSVYLGSAVQKKNQRRRWSNVEKKAVWRQLGSCITLMKVPGKEKQMQNQRFRADTGEISRIMYIIPFNLKKKKGRSINLRVCSWNISFICFISGIQLFRWSAVFCECEQFISPQLGVGLVSQSVIYIAVDRLWQSFNLWIDEK